MSKRTHLRIAGVDARAGGQSQNEFDNQSACGYAGVTVSRIQREVDCKLCEKIIDNNDGVYGGGYDDTM